MGTTRIGYAQFSPVFGDREANLAAVRRLIGSSTADLLVFPELAVSGYEFQGREELSRLAEPFAEGPTAEVIRQLSAEAGMVIVIGYPEQARGRLYNSCMLATPGGGIFNYRKIHLFSRETFLFDPGDRPPPVIDTPAGRIGVMICFDWIYPEIARSLVLNGAQILAHPSNLVLPYCQRAMFARAVENAVFAITANRIGFENHAGRSLTFTGSSQVLDPQGTTLSQAPPDEEHLGIVEVDPGLADHKNITEYNHLFFDRRPQLYRGLSDGDNFKAVRGYSISGAPEGQTARSIIIAIFVLGYLGFAGYFHLVFHKGVVYSHFAYIPIVLASIWWGRGGILVAAVLGCFTFAFHLFGVGYGNVLEDASRVLFFFVVAFCIGLMGEKVLKSQQALRDSEEKYRLIIEKSCHGILVYSEAVVVFANARLSEMLEYPIRELVGKSLWNLIYPQDRPLIERQISRREREGVSDLHYECRLQSRTGNIIWTDIASSQTGFEGKKAVMVHIHDITARKKAEDERKRLAELTRKQEEQLIHSIRLAEMGEMAASVAHELNQPLTGIRNFAKNAIYMIEEKIEEENVKKNLQLITQQVDRASRIINQMRELARKSERQMDLVDINTTLEEIVEFLTPQLKLSRVQVNAELSREIPNVLGDRIRLEQVFLNLITNARQAMEDSDVRHLTVKTGIDPNGDCPVMIEIKDTGKGFGPEEKLFVPFYTTKKAGQGTGLGLPVSFRIIKDHGGTIEALGTPGKGAKFTIRLPIPERLK